MEEANQPRRIKQLDPTVVNRIAAGEVIHRPAHALKELLENAIDSGATEVAVTTRGGGLSLLEVADNGHGIAAADMPIVCARFTTSKLRSFSDLASIATYGFRGEALASISHVAHLRIASRCSSPGIGENGGDTAYCARYADGVMLLSGNGNGNGNDDQSTKGPTPCAAPARHGTTVTVEGLFHNIPVRLRAMRPAAEEHGLVADVVARYAVHATRVGFALRKQGSGAPEIATTSLASGSDDGDQSGRIAAVRSVYGDRIARELLPASSVDGMPLLGEGASIRALLSRPSYSAGKSTTFLLFINDRLVESQTLKRAVKAVYDQYLPKGAHPWAYLALTLPPHTVDVNVHPTKKEVGLLHHDAVVDAVKQLVDDALRAADASRHFATRQVLTVQSYGGTSGGIQMLDLGLGAGSGAQKRRLAELEADEESPLPPPPPSSAAALPVAAPQARRRESHLVRTDARATTLEQYFSPASTAADQVSTQQQQQQQQQVPTDVASDAFIPRAGHERDLGLGSIAELRAELEQQAAREEGVSLADLQYVGHVDGPWIAAQVGTELFLADLTALGDQFFYQRALDLFGNYPTLALRDSGHMKIAEMVRLALDWPESGWTPDKAPKDAVAATIQENLVARAEMLADYFSIEIAGDGSLHALPRLVRGYSPPLDNLPMLLLRLGTEVDWSAEKTCLSGIMDELARFYACIRVDAIVRDQKEDDQAQGQDETEKGWWSEHRGPGMGTVPERDVHHILVPALRTCSLPPDVVAAAFVRLASLPELYKVFERC